MAAEQQQAHLGGLPADGEVADSALDVCIARLSKERAENEACPDNEERNKVLLAMLEFAAAEVAPELFKAVADEMGCESIQETPFLKAYTVLDLVKNTNRDGTELEACIEEFEDTLINYQVHAGRASPVLDEMKMTLKAELKMQICLGRFLGAGRWEGVQALDELEVDCKALKEGIDAHFSEVSDASVLELAGGEPWLAIELVSREKLLKLVALFNDLKRSRPGKRRPDQAHLALEFLQDLMQRHSWAKFIDAIRLYISVMLHTAFGGPSLLRAARSSAAVDALQDPHAASAVGGVSAFLAPSTVPPPPPQHARRRPRRSHRYNMLVRVFKNAGGTSAGWNNIISKSEQDGRNLLAMVLDKADVVHATREQQGQPGAGELLSEADLDDDRIYGDEELYESDDNHNPGFPMAADPQVAQSPARGARRLSSAESVDSFSQFDKYSASEPRKKRKRPTPWSEEETKALLDGIKIFGVGRWAQILHHNAELFARTGRTSVALKDRYRNVETRRIREAAKAGEAAS